MQQGYIIDELHIPWCLWVLNSFDNIYANNYFLLRRFMPVDKGSVLSSFAALCTALTFLLSPTPRALPCVCLPAL